MRSFLAIVLSLCGVLASANQSSYRLDVGDRIAIKVFNEDDMSIETRINDSGAINMPFVGNVIVVGRTATEIEQTLQSTLAAGYLVNPRVSVDILEYRPFFIRGAVKSPGSYPYQPGLTVEQAAAVAGGFTDRADLDSVLRGRDQFGIFKEDRVTLRADVAPGDTVTVEESFF